MVAHQLQGARHDGDLWIRRLARRDQGRQGRDLDRSGALKDYPYGFASRFEGKPGTNPEELIGAAHAGCFTMALSLILGEAKLTAEQMETTAEVTLEKVGDGFAITAVHLTLKAKIPGRRPGEVRGARRQGQGRLPGLQAPQDQDHAGRDAGELIVSPRRREHRTRNLAMNLWIRVRADARPVMMVSGKPVTSPRRRSARRRRCGACWWCREHGAARLRR